MAAKAIQAFQLTEKYNTVLFSLYYKSFKLLRQYLVKHSSRVDLENLEFEEVDKEMEIDEAAQTAATDKNVPEENPTDLEGALLIRLVETRLPLEHFLVHHIYIYIYLVMPNVFLGLKF